MAHTGWHRLWSLVAWDGVLPAVTAGSAWLLRHCLPGAPALAGLLSAMAIPILTAFLRCDIGLRQLQTLCGGRPGVIRQVLLAAAIVVLLLFEAVTNAFQFAAAVPLDAWCVIGGLYAGYLVLIALALRPTSRQSALADQQE